MVNLEEGGKKIYLGSIINTNTQNYNCLPLRNKINSVAWAAPLVVRYGTGRTVTEGVFGICALQEPVPSSARSFLWKQTWGYDYNSCLHKAYVALPPM